MTSIASLIFSVRVANVKQTFDNKTYVDDAFLE